MKNQNKGVIPMKIYRLFFLIALIVLALAAAPVHAALKSVVTVNSTVDTDICQGGTCTLRGAINKANATVGEDTIEFNIPTFPLGVGHCSLLDGTCTISPTSPLPDIT